MLEKKNAANFSMDMVYSFDCRADRLKPVAPPSRHSRERQSHSLIRLIKCKKEPLFDEYDYDKNIPRNFTRIKREYESLQPSPERRIPFIKASSKINLRAMNSDKVISIPKIKYMGSRHEGLRPLEKRGQRIQIHHRRGFTSGNPLPNTTDSKARERRFKHPRICFSNKRLDKKLKAFCLTQKKSESSKISLIRFDTSQGLNLKEKLMGETPIRQKDLARRKLAPMRHPKIKLMPMVEGFKKGSLQIKLNNKQRLVDVITKDQYLMQ
ncbi:unnamed protein product [Moneuplotes crassus]|uniref:Uncharacterized protein n=1 Tax=Euplotes crassus TaxID=5936 RepID=A0AAD1XA30_EUPCR|nr:unnamed protein product [Moneuplotes crassus]